MTELEEARAHLRRSQEWLRMARAGYTNHFGIYVQPGSNSDTIRRCAEDVLSALSWVYDAQERARKNYWIEPGMTVTMSGGKMLRVVAVTRGA